MIDRSFIKIPKNVNKGTFEVRKTKNQSSATPIPTPPSQPPIKKKSQIRKKNSFRGPKVMNKFRARKEKAKGQFITYVLPHKLSELQYKKKDKNEKIIQTSIKRI